MVLMHISYIHRKSDIYVNIFRELQSTVTQLNYRINSEPTEKSNRNKVLIHFFTATKKTLKYAN